MNRQVILMYRCCVALRRLPIALGTTIDVKFLSVTLSIDKKYKCVAVLFHSIDSIHRSVY